MLFAASPWQAAHDWPPFPAGSLHSFAPLVTQSMPGLAKSSACSLRRSWLTNSLPDLSGLGRCGSAPPAAPAAAVRTMAARRRASRLGTGNDERGFFDAALAVVVDPGDFDLAAFLRHGMELEVRIGGDSRAHFGAEDLGAVIAHQQGIDDVLRYRRAAELEAEAGLHRVLDGDAHLDHLSRLRPRRQLHSRDHIRWRPGRLTP